MPEPATPFMSIRVLTKGIGRSEFDLGRGRFSAHVGPGILVVAPHDTDNYFSGPGPVEITGIGFRYSDVVPLLTRLTSRGEAPRDFGPVHESAFFDPQIENLCQCLLVEAASDNPLGDLFADSILTALLGLLLRRGAYRLEQTGRTHLHKQSLARVIEYIHAHSAERVLLENLVEIAGVSRFYFARLFKEATGLPPHEYLIHLRIDRAKAMLAQREERSIASIAVDVGFSDQSHLNRHFKRQLNVTAADYRRRVLA